MKIAHIESFDLLIPNEVVCRPPWAPGREETHRSFTLVLVDTDDGLTGIGGGNGHWAARIRESIAPFLIGEDPAMIARHLRVLRNAPGPWFVELALWDLVGKGAAQPLHRLWGAARDKIPAYASTAELGTPEERAEQARRYLSEGFRAMKLRLHAATLAEDLAYADAVLDAVGDRVELMVDANQATLFIPSPRPGPAWDYARAYRTARALEERGVLWLEEPLARWDYAQLARLRLATSIPIAGGEKNAAHEFRELVAQGSYDILQPDVTMAGTLSDAMRTKALAEVFGLHFVPHHGVSAIGLAATLHLLCTYPGWTYLEYMYDPPYRTVENYQCLGGIVTTPLRIDGEGRIAPPPGWGLGIEIDRSLIRDYLAPGA